MFQPRNIVSAHQTYFPAFDYLRAIAALGVFVGHADRDKILPENFANACVQVFFALSGFLIGGILLRSKREDLPRFFYNRAARIWIPYAIAIGLLAAITTVKQGFADPKIHEFFIYMVTFVYNWFGPPQLIEFGSRMPLNGTTNHFWSICVEEQFYLVAPFLILFLPRFALFAGLAIVTALSPWYFTSISMGVLLAYLGPQIWLIAVCGIVGAVMAVGGPYIAAAALLSTAIVGALSLVRGSQTTVGRIAGGASYPFYLNHWIGLFGINAVLKIGAPYALVWTIGLFIAVALSVAHYLIIDRAIARSRDKWFTPRTGVILCSCAFVLVAIGLTYGLSILPENSPFAGVSVQQRVNLGT